MSDEPGRRERGIERLFEEGPLLREVVSRCNWRLFHIMRHVALMIVSVSRVPEILLRAVVLLHALLRIEALIRPWARDFLLANMLLHVAEARLGRVEPGLHVVL